MLIVLVDVDHLLLVNFFLDELELVFSVTRIAGVGGEMLSLRSLYVQGAIVSEAGRLIEADSSNDSLSEAAIIYSKWKKKKDCVNDGDGERDGEYNAQDGKKSATKKGLNDDGSGVGGGGGEQRVLFPLYQHQDRRSEIGQVQIVDDGDYMKWVLYGVSFFIHSY